MKRILHIGVTLAFLLALVPVQGFAHTEDEPSVVNLIADGGSEATAIDVGDVSVWNDADYLYVKYEITDPDWCLTKTHLHVADTLEGIPQTSKGNPKPGQFKYKMDHDCVGEYTYSIGLGEWSTDTVLYIAAHAEVISVDDGGPFWASSVVSSIVGIVRPSTSVSWWVGHRDDPANALGTPDDVFFSPGFGGETVVEFDGWVYNGDGYDISVHETTFGRSTYPEETADVYGWYEDAWHLLGSVSNHDPSGIGMVNLGALPYVEQVRIVDTTPVANFDGFTNADAYDLNAVDAVTLFREETAWGEGFDFPGKNWAMYLTYTVQEPPIVFAGWDTGRGGSYSLNHADSSQARSDLEAAYADVEFRALSDLTASNLSDVDVVVLSSVKGNSGAITPLTGAEQNALGTFVEGGGCAILFPDNSTFAGGNSDPANESLIDPFGLDITGTLSGGYSATFSSAWSSVTSYVGNYTGWFDGINGASTLATLASTQPSLVEFAPDSFTTGSGRVIVFSDANVFFGGSAGRYSSNTQLFLDAVDACFQP